MTDQAQDLGAAAFAVLQCADAKEKASLSLRLGDAYLDGAIAHGFSVDMPDRPGRPANPELLPPKDMPRRRKGGTLENRVALLHALAHIELNAIDLAWDAAARFGAGMPTGYARDWVGVGHDEARHFLMLCARLEDLGSHYGALPAHDGLWQAAYDTRADLLGRLSVVPLVLEARGLDVSPATIERLRKNGDEESANVLQTIYEDEIGHVRIGVKWFNQCCQKSGQNPESVFDTALEKYFSGTPKPPFNTAARRAAQFPDRLYNREKRT